MSDNAHFLGMTKATYTRVLLAFLILIVISQLFLTYRQEHIIAQHTESHKALCALKKDYDKRVSDSQKFLALSEKQRVNVYGEALGRIPSAVILKSLRTQRANLADLQILKCN